MTLLGFIALGLFIFIILLALESVGDKRGSLLNGTTSLIGWLFSGNWPAKVGAILLIIGVGSLLRYAMMHIDFPAEIKIGSGIGVSVILGILSFVLYNNEERRPIGLALGGAALAIAYMTAFSAYAYFNYMPQTTAFSFLVVISLCGALFAVRSNALSIALLSMLGAYLAPAFVLRNSTQADITVIYGYYLCLSLICLLTTWQRGWRPLIHLSFLFTLAGAWVMGWLNHYFVYENFQILMPWILGIFAVHALMPITESKGITTKNNFVAEKADHLYVWFLAFAGIGIAFKLAPTVKVEGSFVLCILALIWTIGASILKRTGNHPLKLRYALAGVITLYFAISAALPDISWSVLAITIAALIFVRAEIIGISPQRQTVLSIIIIVLALFHMVSASFIINDEFADIFVSSGILYKLVVALSLLGAGFSGLPRQAQLARTMIWMGGLWGGIAMLQFVMQMHLPPAVISAIFVVVGAIILLYGHQNVSRGFWTSGALVMAAASAKLVLMDFGSLGQLENILAMIGAGCVFLGVSWLAPYPPAVNKTAEPSVSKAEAKTEGI